MIVSLLTITLLFLLLTLSEGGGTVIRHRFSVSYFTGAPDGVLQRKILGINGQFPGPTIRANVGDTLAITLVNEIQDGQNTTLHWHGINLKGYLFEDGASQITQCSVPQGESQVYRFNVTQSGTFWYHSHVRSQYSEGLFGALIITDHGTDAHYHHDGELIIMLSDWYHQSGKENEAWYFSPGNRSVPYPNSGLINGFGRYPCDVALIQNRTCYPSQQFRPVYTLQRAASYRLRVINTAAFASFNFSIDGHRVQVIELDGIDVATPPSVDTVPIAPGQRYSVLFTPMATGRILARAVVRREHMRLIPETNINKYPEALMEHVSAILNVIEGDLSEEPYMVVESTEQFPYTEILPPPVYQYDEIVALEEMELSPRDRVSAPDPVSKEFTVYTDAVVDQQNVTRSALNRTIFQVPEDKPMIMSFLEQGLLPNRALVVEVDYGDVVQLILNNPQPEPHPFHLHGHHFWVVGLGKAGDGNYRDGSYNLTMNGPMRDTVVVQMDSWVVIRFLADNPGIWAFHCHNDWHNIAGMAMVFVEAGDVLIRDIVLTDEAKRVCSLHDRY